MVDSKPYVPQRGDVIWITLNPQAGHEQAGRRPALVLSPAAYNGKVGLAILCPLTNQEMSHGNTEKNKSLLLYKARGLSSDKDLP